MQDQNPFVAGESPMSAAPPSQARPSPPSGTGVTIPFEVGDRALFGRTARWMMLAGVGNLVVGVLTLASLFVDEFSGFGLVRGLLWIAVGVLALLAGRASKAVATASAQDLPHLDALFAKIRVLFAVKAGAALAAIALALTVWRFAIQYGV